ncbi:MAG: protein kinase [Lachnospiraceae bacterium]|nr:protein kinase [Robinsoniella sp.]MDY3766207.1 protein kinase [Lachnospiraceae bacterium]
MIKCMGCMKDYSAQKQECPYCGYPREWKNVSTACQRPGTMLGERYIVGKAFHQDSIGISYIGWDSLIEKKVVIKEYFPEKIAFRIDGQEIVSEPKWEKLYEAGKKAFVQEIENWNHIDHMEGIARVYDQAMQYGTVYYVREYVNGMTIRQILERENPILFNRARRWTRQVIHILSQLERLGLSHGNLSIDNVVITDDAIVLTNFGVRVNDNRARGILFEENPYIPREVYEETEIFWKKADVYAVAAMFYRMVTGQMPYFQSRRIKKEKITSPSELGIRMQAETEKQLMDLLNADPKKKNVQLKKLDQIFLTTSQEMRSESRKEKSKSYFLMILIGIEGVIALLLAIILIVVW